MRGVGRGARANHKPAHTLLAFIKPLLARAPGRRADRRPPGRPAHSQILNLTLKQEQQEDGAFGRPAGVLISLQLNIRAAGGEALRRATVDPLFLASSCFQTYTPVESTRPARDLFARYTKTKFNNQTGHRPKALFAARTFSI